jgi:deoxyribodipyrimidine photo-lyase
MTTHLVWFRQDLRLHDNLALAAACRNSSARVLALYIATPRQWETHNMSPRQAELINAQLNGLQIALAEKGIPLLFREVDDFVASVEIVKQVCAENSVTHLFYNYQYEVNERARDVEVERALRNVVCEGFDDSVILPPGAVMTGCSSGSGRRLPAGSVAYGISMPRLHIIIRAINLIYLFIMRLLNTNH